MLTVILQRKVIIMLLNINTYLYFAYKYTHILYKCIIYKIIIIILNLKFVYSHIYEWIECFKKQVHHKEILKNTLYPSPKKKVWILVSTDSVRSKPVRCSYPQTSLIGGFLVTCYSYLFLKVYFSCICYKENFIFIRNKFSTCRYILTHWLLWKITSVVIISELLNVIWIIVYMNS